MATQNAAPEASERVSRAILEDRYDGLLVDPVADDPTRLQERLWRDLRALISGVMRDPDADGMVLDAVMADVHDSVLRHVIEATTWRAAA